MEDEEKINPWVTISKKKRNRTFAQSDVAQNGSSKSEVDNLQSNTFTNLTLQESTPGDNAKHGRDLTFTSGIHHPPPSPGIPPPPRKRSKKDPKKVFLSKSCPDIEKSHYPSIKIREDAVNRQVNLTVSSYLSFLTSRTFEI
jgi:hypothetical protein